MRVTMDGFAGMARRLRDAADRWSAGRVIAVLEGGYDLEGVGGGMASVLSVFDGPAAPPPITRTITFSEGMTVKDLADRLDVRVKDALKALLDRRMMMTINSAIDLDTAKALAANRARSAASDSTRNTA